MGQYLDKPIVNVLTSQTENIVDSFYRCWCNIKWGNKESMEKYTVRYIQIQTDIEEAFKSFLPEELTRKWKQRLGMNINNINTIINYLRNNLPRWSNILIMYQFMEKQMQGFYLIHPLVQHQMNKT